MVGFIVSMIYTGCLGGVGALFGRCIADVIAEVLPAIGI